MQETVSVTGMILKTEPIGDFDRRVVILTGEKGKIAAFAKGARRQGSRLLAATNPFCFGRFELFRGRNAFTVTEVNIKNYFAGLRVDYEAAFYGMYFLEMMDYYTRENNDERMVLNLLYQSLKALEHPRPSNRLIRYIFEIKALALNGEYPGLPADQNWDEATIYTVDYVAASRIEKLYNFTVSDTVLKQLKMITDIYRRRFIDKPFKSLEFLDTLPE